MLSDSDLPLERGLVNKTKRDLGASVFWGAWLFEQPGGGAVRFPCNAMLCVPTRPLCLQSSGRQGLPPNLPVRGA